MTGNGCRLCGLEGTIRPGHTFGAYSVSVCSRCGLGQLDPLPSAAEIAALYDDRSYFGGATADGPGYDSSYAGLAPHLEEGFARDVAELVRMGCHGRLLDVGCGPGLFLDAAAAAGFRVRGLDLSEYALEMARARNLEVHRSTLEAHADTHPESCDVLYACHLIEHVPDPIAFAAAAATVLRPGGLLVCITPNRRSWLARISGRRWVSFKIPEHLHYFDPSSIRRLLEPHFVVSSVRPVRGHYPLWLVLRRLRQLAVFPSRWVPRFENQRWLRALGLAVFDGTMKVMATRR